MELDQFSRQLQDARHRLAAYQERGSGHTPSANDLVGRAFQELDTALEELSVSEEEMRAQNEYLAQAQGALEGWRHYYEDLFEFAPDAYLVTDREGLILEANKAATALLGLSDRFRKGKPLANFIALEQRREFRHRLGLLRQGERKQDWDVRIAPRQGTPFESFVSVAAAPAPPGRPPSLRWLIRDASARKAAEEERYRRLVADMRDHAIFTLDAEGCILSGNTEAERLTGYREAQIVGESFALLLTPEAVQAGQMQRELAQAATEGRADEEGWHVRKDGSRFWASGVLSAQRDKAGDLTGFVKVMRDFTERRRSEERLSSAYEREHRIAETFQRALLPQIAEDAFDGLSVATLYAAAWAEAQVGGDFFDAVALEGGAVGLLVGDVSGKGLAAAIYSAEIKNVLRAFLREGMDPAWAVARLNAFLYAGHRLDGLESELFSTLAVVVLRPQTGEGTASVAGAEPPIILRRDGSAEVLALRGRLLGVEPADEFESIRFVLAPGDTLLLATDGITEARRGRHFLEITGLVDLARKAMTQETLSDMGQTILDGAREFAHGSLSDDACLLLARLRPTH